MGLFTSAFARAMTSLGNGLDDDVRPMTISIVLPLEGDTETSVIGTPNLAAIISASKVMFVVALAASAVKVMAETTGVPEGGTTEGETEGVVVVTEALVAEEVDVIVEFGTTTPVVAVADPVDELVGVVVVVLDNLVVLLPFVAVVAVTVLLFVAVAVTEVVFVAVTVTEVVFVAVAVTEVVFVAVAVTEVVFVAVTGMAVLLVEVAVTVLFVAAVAVAVLLLVAVAVDVTLPVTVVLTVLDVSVADGDTLAVDVFVPSVMLVAETVLLFVDVAVAVMLVVDVIVGVSVTLAVVAVALAVVLIVAVDVLEVNGMDVVAVTEAGGAQSKATSCKWLQGCRELDGSEYAKSHCCSVWFAAHTTLLRYT